MIALLLYVVASVSYALKCKDFIIGTNNGSVFNFENTLRCPTNTTWCMNLNVDLHLPQQSVDGSFGNCENNGFVGALVNLTKPYTDLSCKVVGCDNFTALNITRCCCNTDLCNIADRISVLLLLLILMTNIMLLF
ncbi:hypothetical protein KIN20_002554 [Parelaphostrongylus tenuis]|uniref:Uncharacterized protein n=1 Tax=Parelaphostrongylus tenuis TaxID=148309 RepID=A0AAD5MNR4_PARTN|nr:hypothetical protein KIN20_002554 [Parelaphostrongylus tenuis]